MGIDSNLSILPCKPYETEGEHYISDDTRNDSGDIEYKLFGVGYVDSKTIYSTRKVVPQNTKDVYDSRNSQQY
jgi:hypothetical protein